VKQFWPLERFPGTPDWPPLLLAIVACGQFKLRYAVSNNRSQLSNGRCIASAVMPHIA